MSAVLSTERKSDDVSETRAYSHRRSVKTPHATAQTGSSSAPPKVDKDRRAGEVRAAPDEGDNQHAITQGGEGRTLEEERSKQRARRTRGGDVEDGGERA